MNLFDSLVKLNTYIVGMVVLFVMALTTMTIINPDLALPIAKNQGVVAGAYADEPAVAPVTPTPTATPTPTPIPVTNPIHISIPTLGVEADIEEVGVTSNNVMEIPHDFFKVGWYKESVKPGENGGKAAIINGHYDTATGKPAVFYHIQNLTKDDEIIITSENRIRYIFKIHDIQSHPLENFPSDIVYGAVDSISLKLITCDGYWQTDKKSYSDRLVVTAHLVRIERPI